MKCQFINRNRCVARRSTTTFRMIAFSFFEECSAELFSHAKELLGINKKPNNTITKM